MDSDEKDIVEKLLKDDDSTEEEITKRQWQILDAAVKVFSEKGFEGSRTSDIAKEAEVAEGTIFKYFKTKKELLKGLMIPLILKFFKPMMFNSLENIMKKGKDRPIDEVMKDIMIDR
ncbi:MAG: helix-turn-helix domain-containing protein, partial [Bacillota bacterium]|nr:helix-turn-helix domain-containing protein [Bacillota bacterium]